MILGIDASRAIKQEKTGVEWYSYFLLRAMERCTPEGWKVKCYVRDKMGLWGHESKDWKWRVLKWPASCGWTQGRLVLEMIFHRSDALFISAYTIPYAHPKNTVVTIHDVIFMSQPELYDPQDLQQQQHSLRLSLRGAKQIIVPSQATRDDLLHAGVKAEKITVIPHGMENLNVHVPGNKPLTQHETLRFVHSDIGRYILFIGRLEKKKNVLGLVRAFKIVAEQADFSDLKLLLAGSLGYGGPEILKEIEALNLKQKVVNLGWTSRDKYFNLLKNAALLALPSFGEGFGLPVLEAMAAGVPAVCSDLSALHEVGGKAVLYVNPKSPEDIARGLAIVLRDAKLRQEMIAKGVERAKEYTWEKAAGETWRVITSL